MRQILDEQRKESFTKDRKNENTTHVSRKLKSFFIKHKKDVLPLCDQGQDLQKIEEKGDSCVFPYCTNLLFGLFPLLSYRFYTFCLFPFSLAFDLNVVEFLFGLMKKRLSSFVTLSAFLINGTFKKLFLCTEFYTSVYYLCCNNRCSILRKIVNIRKKNS